MDLSKFYAQVKKQDGTPQRMLALDDEVPENAEEAIEFYGKVLNVATKANEDGLRVLDLRLRKITHERIGDESVPLDKPQYVVTLIAVEEYPIQLSNITYNKFSEV